MDVKVLNGDPFQIQTIDHEGVGELVRIGVDRGRATKPNLKVGSCGEHGGDHESVKFFYRVGMIYVSCSPFSVLIALPVAVQAAIKFGKQNYWISRLLRSIDFFCFFFLSGKKRK